MRVLIVEDNEFNAFCLRRLLESVLAENHVTVANDSNTALSLCSARSFDLVILDGMLGAMRGDRVHCNGAELAQILLCKYPNLPLIAWTDSALMRQAFVEVFQQHDRVLNDFTLWNKNVTMETICKTWVYHFAEFLDGPIAMYQQPYWIRSQSKSVYY